MLANVAEQKVSDNYQVVSEKKKTFLSDLFTVD